MFGVLTSVMGGMDAWWVDMLQDLSENMLLYSARDDNLSL